MRMSVSELHEALGLKPPEQQAPATRLESAMAEKDALQAKHDAIVSKNQREGESFEQAAARTYREVPELYPTMKKAMAGITAKVSADAATGGL
ncbi:MAG: hypothetical protein WDM85_01265 [Caulobacteraceae bacterium]